MKNISVLIIDDSDEDRYLLKRQLGETSLKVTVFEKNNGQSAIDFLTDYEANRNKYPDDFPPVILFLDINMPLLNGFEFLEEFATIREPNHMEASVVMMFTSSEREDDKLKIAAYDYVKSYLVKGSFSTEELEQKIKQVLGD